MPIVCPLGKSRFRSRDIPRFSWVSANLVFSAENVQFSSFCLNFQWIREPMPWPTLYRLSCMVCSVRLAMCAWCMQSMWLWTFVPRTKFWHRTVLRASKFLARSSVHVFVVHNYRCKILHFPQIYYIWPTSFTLFARSFLRKFLIFPPRFSRGTE